MPPADTLIASTSASPLTSAPETAATPAAPASSTPTPVVTPLPRRRHHRIRPTPPSASDFVNQDRNDTFLLIPPHLRKNSFDEKVKSTFAGGVFGRPPQQSSNSLAGIFVLIFVLIGIVIVLLLFYFLAKVCNGPRSSGKKIKTANGTIIVRNHGEREIEVVPSKVPYPKRIYELKAEEGYFSCPPSLQQSLTDIYNDSDDDPAFSKPTNARRQSLESSETKTNSASQSEPTSRSENLHRPDPISARKLTAAGIPAGFKPKGRLQQLMNGGS